MSPTVLVVDDSLPQHKLVKALLEPDAVEVHSAYDGVSALKAATTLLPALILLDVDIPGLDGFEVCRQLKANAITAATPVLFVTADGVLADKVRGLELGASDYIAKPFKPEELRARVRAALRTKSQLDQNAMIDGQTALWNRTYLEAHLPAQLSLAQRSSRPLACTMGDVDGLPGLADTYGEGIRNSILRCVARTLLGGSRPEDVVCRIESGKFVMLAPGATRGAAALMANRLRLELERQLAVVDGLPVKATCSFGVADTVVAAGPALLERAEASLLRARRDGRNSVYIAGPVSGQAHALAA